MTELPIGPFYRDAEMRKKAVIDRDHFLAIIQRLETQHQNLDNLALEINRTLAQAIRNPNLSPEQLEQMRVDAVGGEFAARHPGIAGRIRTIDDIRQNLDQFPMRP